MGICLDTGELSALSFHCRAFEFSGCSFCENIYCTHTHKTLILTTLFPKMFLFLIILQSTIIHIMDIYLTAIINAYFVCSFKRLHNYSAIELQTKSLHPSRRVLTLAEYQKCVMCHDTSYTCF